MLYVIKRSCYGSVSCALVFSLMTSCTPASVLCHVTLQYAMIPEVMIDLPLQACVGSVTSIKDISHQMSLSTRTSVLLPDVLRIKDISGRRSRAAWGHVTSWAVMWCRSHDQGKGEGVMGLLAGLIWTRPGGRYIETGIIGRKLFKL